MFKRTLFKLQLIFNLISTLLTIQKYHLLTRLLLQALLHQDLLQLYALAPLHRFLRGMTHSGRGVLEMSFNAKREGVFQKLKFATVGKIVR